MFNAYLAKKWTLATSGPGAMVASFLGPSMVCWRTRLNSNTGQAVDPEALGAEPASWHHDAAIGFAWHTHLPTLSALIL